MSTEAKQSTYTWEQIATMLYNVAKGTYPLFNEWIEAQEFELKKSEASAERDRLKEEKEKLRLEIEQLNPSYKYIHKSRSSVDQELVELRKELVEVLRLYEAYTLADILKNLIEATDRLLGYYSYDGQRYEELQLCSKLGKDAIIKINSVLQKAKEL